MFENNLHEIPDEYLDKLNKLVEPLTKQIELYFNQFNTRRTYEWKFCLVIWATIATFIALILKGEIDLTRAQIIYYIAPLLITVCGIIFFEIYFLSNLKRANEADRKKAQVFQEKLRNIFIRLELKWEEADNAVNIALTKGRTGWWSPITQTGITCVLISCALFVIAIKATSINDMIGCKYSVQTVGGTYMIKQEEKNLYAVIKWDPNCPLPPVFRFQPQEISISTIDKDKNRQAAINSLLDAIAKYNYK